MRCHMLGHAALQEAGDSTETPRTDHDRIEATFLGDPLDRGRSSAGGLENGAVIPCFVEECLASRSSCA